MSTLPSSIQTPDLRALLMQVRREIFFSLNCHQIGQIVSFDASKQTASIQLQLKRVVYNQEQQIESKLQTTPTIIDYPVLVDCPVMVLSGGNACLTFPVAAGDPFLVLFNDRDMDAWYATGSNVQPNSQRAHDLSDGLAIVGFRNLTNPVPTYSTSDAELRHADGKVVAKATGNVEAVSANGGLIQVEDKVGISNASTSLKTVVDNLCSALTNWVDTRGDTPNTATVTAINNVKSLADSLLK